MVNLISSILKIDIYFLLTLIFFSLSAEKLDDVIFQRFVEKNDKVKSILEEYDVKLERVRDELKVLEEEKGSTKKVKVVPDEVVGTKDNVTDQKTKCHTGPGSVPGKKEILLGASKEYEFQTAQKVTSAPGVDNTHTQKDSKFGLQTATNVKQPPIGPQQAPNKDFSDPKQSSTKPALEPQKCDTQEPTKDMAHTKDGKTSASGVPKKSSKESHKKKKTSKKTVSMSQPVGSNKQKEGEAPDPDDIDFVQDVKSPNTSAESNTEKKRHNMYDTIINMVSRRKEKEQKFVQPVTYLHSKYISNQVEGYLDEAIKKGMVGSLDQKIVPEHNALYFVKGKDPSKTKHLDKLGFTVNDGRKTVVGGTKITYIKGKNQRGPSKSVIVLNDKKHMAIHYKLKSRKDEEEKIDAEPESTCQEGPVVNPENRPLADAFEKATPITGVTDYINRTNCKIYIDEAGEQQVNDSTQTIVTDPKGGEYYVFDVRGFDNWREHLPRDGKSWKPATLPVPKYRNTVHLTRYYSYKEDKSINCEFTKYIYHDPESQKVLIQYRGDETTAIQGPHGNSKENLRPHIPRSGVVKSKVETAAADKPTGILHAINRKAGEGMAGVLTQPRDAAQVKYIRGVQKKRLALGANELTSVYRVAEAFPNYIRELSAVPDHHLYVLVNQETLEHYRTVLRNLPEGHITQYQMDTSFNFNNKYLTTLSYICPIFVRPETANNKATMPTIPLFSFVHQRKTDFDHRKAFFIAKEVITNVIPEWETYPKLLVTDREFRGNDYLPNARHVYCWNHLKKNLDYYAYNNLHLNEDIRRQASRDFVGMIRSRTLETYEDRLRNASNTWPAELHRYYMRNLDQPVRERAGRWYLDELGLEDTRYGLTTNAAESLNHIYAQFREPAQKLQTHELIIELKVMDDDLARECTRAYYSQGKFAVRREYAHLVQPTSAMPAFAQRSTKEIIEELAAERRTEEEELEKEIEREQQADAKEVPEYARLAKDIVDSNSIACVKIDNQRYYTIKERDGNIVNLNLETSTCSCGSKNVCHHMIATRVHVGLQSHYEYPKGAKKYPVGKDKKGKQPTHGRKQPTRSDGLHEAIAGRKRGSKMKIPDIKEMGTGDLPTTKEGSDSDAEVKKKRHRLNSDGDTDYDSLDYSQHSELESLQDIIDNNWDEESPDVSPFKGTTNTTHFSKLDKDEKAKEQKTSTPAVSSKDHRKNAPSPPNISNIDDNSEGTKVESNDDSKEAMDNGQDATGTNVDHSQTPQNNTSQSAKDTGHLGGDAQDVTANNKDDSQAHDTSENEKADMKIGGDAPDANATDMDTSQAGINDPNIPGDNADVTAVPLDTSQQERLRKVDELLISRNIPPKYRDGTTVPPTPFTSSQQTLDLSAQLTERDIRLHDFEYKLYKGEGGKEFVVKCIRKTAVVIMKPKVKLDVEMRNIAAKSVAMHATLRDTKSKDPKYFVNISTVQAKEDLLTEAEKTTKAIQRNTASLRLQCYCSVPIEKKEIRDGYAITCSQETCTTVFHKTCAGNPVDVKKWSCATCNMQTWGVKWGLKVFNTCTIDNSLTLHAEIAARHEGYLNLFNNPQPGDQAWYQTLHLACNADDGAQAHINWAKYLRLDDLYGSPEDMLTTHLRDTVTFERNGQCNNKDCKEQYFCMEQRLLAFQPHIADPLESVYERTMMADITPCPSCEGTDYVVEYGQLEPPNVKRPPPYLEISNGLRKFNFDEVQVMPHEIELGEYTYELKMATMRSGSESAKRTGHFFAFMRFDDQWLHYDGLNDKEARFRPARTAMWTDKDVSVYSVTYTIHGKHMKNFEKI